jgi:hypothetical protein
MSLNISIIHLVYRLFRPLVSPDGIDNMAHILTCELAALNQRS